MIIGTVVHRRPILLLIVRGPDGKEVTVEALLDTGFNGFLSLPTSIVTTLSLPFRSYVRAHLADGTAVRLVVYAAIVVWNGGNCDIEVLAADRQPLLGTALLDGYQVMIRFAEGDLVSIQPL